MSSVPSRTSGDVAAGDAGPGADGRRRSFSGPTAMLVGVALLVALVWGGFMVIGELSERHPDLTPALIAGTLTGLIVLAIFGMRAADAPPPLPKKRPDPEDDGGGGGQRRPQPTPKPRQPTPSGPEPPPSAPWDEFDALRSGWERVPAGRS